MPYMLRDMLRAPRCTALRLTRVVLIMCLLGLGSFELYSAPAGGTELSANGVSTTGVNTQATAGGPRVLIINAHPDDESGCAVTVYKITHELGGIVDLCLITNGEGGYKYSTLAEPVYGLELTDEKIGRAHLPRIRKEEMMNAGKIIGLRNIFFLEHWDQRYTTDVDEVFREAWDSTRIAVQLQEILRKGAYDFVLCLLPTAGTHGAHSGASILALRQVQRMQEPRPAILGVGYAPKDSLSVIPKTLAAFPETALMPNVQPFVVDRSASFGFKNRLSYHIIVAWLVAEHKSQGTVQLGMNTRDLEVFYPFACNSAAALSKAQSMFASLQRVGQQVKTYPEN
jgi:LmbE family N-acetylglucosaminyl deacetylase